MLKKNTLKFSDVGAFNDPFDCRGVYDPDAWMVYAKDNGLLKKASNLSKLSASKRILQRRPMEYRLRSMIESGMFHEEAIRSVGITCFSNKFDNILMWSHYASKHTGFLVEFTLDDEHADISLNDIEWFLQGFDVEYQIDMPQISPPNHDDPFLSVKETFLYKAKDWEYEQEYRVISFKKGAGIHEFNPYLITGVIAGAKMPDNLVLKLKSLTEILMDRCNNKVTFEKASLSTSCYTLDFCEC